MKKLNITLLTAFAVATVFAPSAQAVPVLPTVGSYRLVFQTSNKESRQHTTMADFDTWATGLAHAAGAVDAGNTLGTTWHVIGATVADPDILARTGTHPVDDAGTSVPIFLTNGVEFAADYATLWSNAVPTIANGGLTLYIDEFGNVGDAGGPTHTGLTTNGVDTNPILAPGEGLDVGATGAIRHGGGNSGYNNASTPWYAGADSGDNWAGGDQRVFVISGVITAIPEPSSVALLVLGGVGLIIARRRKA